MSSYIVSSIRILLSVWPIDGTRIGATAPDRNGSWSNGNEKVNTYSLRSAGVVYNELIAYSVEG